MILNWQTSMVIQTPTHMRMVQLTMNQKLEYEDSETRLYIVYQVWLDTTQFSATNTEKHSNLGITDNYDEDKLDVNSIQNLR